MHNQPNPVVHPDSSISAVVLSPVDEQGYLRIQAPPGFIQPQDGVAGRYVLARCGADGGFNRQEEWSLYRRRALFLCGYSRGERADIWRLHVPEDNDPGHRWLRQLPEESQINLLGPLGQGFHLHPTSRNLLLLAPWQTDDRGVAPLLPLIESVLADGGRVTLLVYAEQPLSPPQRSSLPLSVEIRSAATLPDLTAALAETARWADQVAVTLPASFYTPVVQTLRAHRFHLDAGFAQVLVHADLLCGVGACLACVVPLPHGGVTRACIHGPVFDLVKLVG